MSIKNKIRKSLKALFYEGLFSSFMSGATGNYISPYAIALKANTSQIGLLSSLPTIAASLAQLKSADITQKLGSRKKAVAAFVLLHALMLLPIIFIPYLCRGYEVILLIISFTLFTGFNSVAGPNWSSLVSDYLPSNKRGRYFGWYNRTFGIIGIVFIFIIGLILAGFKNNALTGFTVIFSIAFISRLIAWHFLNQLYERPLKIKENSCRNLLDFIKGVKKSNFAKFVILIASFNFSINLAAPFYNVYLLRDLKISYFTYTIFINVATVASFLVVRRWGANADIFGNIKVLKAASFLVAAIPFLWIFNHSPFYLAFIYALSGFAGCGFNLSSGNFVYDAVSPAERVRYISYYSFLNSAAISLGAITGGYLVNYLPFIFGNRILSLFFLSGILGLFVAIISSRSLKEARRVEEITPMKLYFSVIGIKPTAASRGFRRK